LGSLIAAALSRAQTFLLDPPTAREQRQAPEVAAVAAIPDVQVVVTGTSRRSGATTVARALAQALALPGSRSSHLVALRPDPGGVRPPKGVATWEVPPALEDPSEIAEYGGTLARLARGSGRAAVVWDVPADDVSRAAGAIQACEVVVCVADGEAEPALCALVSDMLGERYGRPVLLVANRVRDDDAWAGRCAVAMPDSRVAAMVISRGRAPGAAFGAAIERLTALVEDYAVG
jgi:hypothetical protein